jgi:hypothetical protein
MPSQSLITGRYSGMFKSEKFRRSKRDKGVYVEKNKYRIDTPGEKQEITKMGLNAIRRMWSNVYNKHV